MNEHKIQISDAIHNLNQKMRYRHGVIKEPKLTTDIQKEKEDFRWEKINKFGQTCRVRSAQKIQSVFLLW